MGRRTIAILIFVVGILILAVVVAVLLLDTGETTPPPVADGGEAPPVVVEEQATIPPLVNVFVSLQTVPRGFQYPQTEEELEGLVIVDQRPTAAVKDNVITDIEDILGLYARNDIYQGETFTKDSLVDDPRLIGRENYGPSSLIPVGSIAAAIPMDRLNSVAYALDEGDHVDIMISFRFLQIDEEFQTFLRNQAVFSLEVPVEPTEEGVPVEGEPQTTLFIISPYGRFEELPTGDLAHISPSQFQRPVPVSMILQNAKVIQVGAWTPPALVQPPTPVPTPSAEEAEATPTPFAQVTPIPEPPDVLVVALTPQQQLLLKYAIESNADIDFALRGANDSQTYTLENIDLRSFLERFGFEVPPNLNFTIDIPVTEEEPTPEAPGGEGAAAPEGG